MNKVGVIDSAWSKEARKLREMMLNRVIYSG